MNSVLELPITMPEISTALNNGKSTGFEVRQIWALIPALPLIGWWQGISTLRSAASSFVKCESGSRKQIYF